jgi:hypothetical protein
LKNFGFRLPNEIDHSAVTTHQIPPIGDFSKQANQIKDHGQEEEEAIQGSQRGETYSKTNRNTLSKAKTKSYQVYK